MIIHYRIDDGRLFVKYTVVRVDGVKAAVVAPGINQRFESGRHTNRVFEYVRGEEGEELGAQFVIFPIKINDVWIKNVSLLLSNPALQLCNNIIPRNVYGNYYLLLLYIRLYREAAVANPKRDRIACGIYIYSIFLYYYYYDAAQYYT